MRNSLPDNLPGMVVFSGYDRQLALDSVGEGWKGLINKVFDILEKEKDKHIKIVQVKEKFGGLRIYTDNSTEDFDNFIYRIELESFNVCEICGNPGKLRSGGWYKTLCDSHAEGREPITPF